MKKNSVTLPTAYMIETLRRNGVTNEGLLEQIKQKDITPWEVFQSPFDFTVLVKLYEEDKIAFKSIINEGYHVKFVTIRGLQTLLELKFHKIPERDYQLLANGVSKLQLDEQQVTLLKQILSTNWQVIEVTKQTTDEKVTEVAVQAI